MTDDATNVADDAAAPDADAAAQGGHRDLIADRLRKRDRLRDELGQDPYGRAVPGVITLAEAEARYDQRADDANKDDPTVDDRPVVRVAGRVMAHRVMGNLIFMSLRDATGDLQLAVSKKLVGQPGFSIAKAVDLSDIVIAEGPLAKTKKGEISVWAGGDRAPDGRAPLDPPVQVASKSIAPPPGKWHGLTDPEQRYRKRYVDLYANPQVMRTMRLRVRIIDEIRDYLRGRGFEEVETPMLQTLHGGAAARPFETHHNALDLPLFMRIAPELYLKRLLVGGMPKVFEINRNFRNEGISPRHNPEFTMLEAYEAFGSWETMADLVEDMVCTVAEKVFGTLVLNHQDTRDTKEDSAEPASAGGSGSGRTINLTRPWRRVSMVDLVEERTGWRFEKTALPADHDLAASLATRAGERVASDAAKWDALSPAEQLVEVYEKLIEPTLIDPCFVTHVPSVIIPLAKKNADDPYFADVYELAINGVEISPGYSELNDPEVQEANFRQQVGDEAEQQAVDEDFLEALRVGMPPAGGMGLGIDRLVMMLTGAESIRDVILFPLMRPEAQTETKSRRDGETE